MEEIVKDRTIVTHYTVYKAFDGQEFTDKEECQIYENSALGILRSRILKCVVNKNWNAWALMGGYDGHIIVAVKLTNITELDSFHQWLYVECPWYSDENHAKRKKEIEEIINTAYQNQDLILLGQNCDGGYYFINSRQNIIGNLMGLDEKEEKE